MLNAGPPPRRDRGAVPKRPPSPFRVGSYPPLPLAHPLQVFGSTFAVHISTSLTLHPDTMMRAVMDRSMQTVIRAREPTLHQFLRKLQYVASKKHRLSKGMRDLTVRELGRFMPATEIEKALDHAPQRTAPDSDWANLLTGLQGCDGELFHDIATCLAACDAHALYLQALAVNGQHAQVEDHFKHLLGPAQEAWKSLNPTLNLRVLVLVEVALKTLAWLECRTTTPDQNVTLQPISRVASLLDPGRRPLGHWLGEVCQASHCDDLKALSNALGLRKATHLRRPLKHDLLKKWSASKVVAMPGTAVAPVLRAVRLKERAQTLESRFYVARLLTFLCDLTRSGTPGAAPLWAEVQTQINSRHAEAYRLEVARLLTPPP